MELFTIFRQHHDQHRTKQLSLASNTGLLTRMEIWWTCSTPKEQFTKLIKKHLSKDRCLILSQFIDYEYSGNAREMWNGNDSIQGFSWLLLNPFREL